MEETPTGSAIGQFHLTRLMDWRSAAISLAAASAYAYYFSVPPLYPCLGALAVVALLRLRVLLFEPLVYSTTADKFRAGATRRKPGTLPPVYPNGWYVSDSVEGRNNVWNGSLSGTWVVMFSHDLKVGDVKPVEFMGHSLVVFRTRGGEAKVLDAYCPHLGANLGIGGKLVGDSIECPFHGWQFNGEGQCTQIPGQQMIPEKAQLRKWHVLDVNDKIIVWHHADKLEPDWTVPDFIQDFQFHGESEHTIACHVQEIAENGPDVAHLNFLHRPWIGTSIKGIIHHIWSASWTPGSEENHDKHLAYISLTQEMASFGRSIPFTRNTVNILQCGPGMVHLDFPLPLGLHVRIIEEVMPIAPLMQRVRHSVYASRWTPRFLAKIFLRLLIRILEQDVPIWNNKTYLQKPMYSKPDKAIPVYRRWYQQFYSESSPQAASLLNPLDW